MANTSEKKTERQLERHFKGVANHRRIAILMLIRDRERITVQEIADELDGNVKTISEHTRRLVQAGLVDKKYRGRSVEHKVSPYGKIFIKFIETFQHS